MNSLTLFIYFAEVTGNINNIVGGFCIILGATVAVSIVAREVTIGDNTEIPKENLRSWNRWNMTILIIWLFLLVINIFTPSSRTMYLMAASELGETIVTTPEAKEIMSDIHEIIKNQLKDLKE